MRRILWLTTVVLTLATQIICSAQNLTYWPDPRWKAPPGAVAESNPLADRPELATGGRKLFLRNCAECHGKDGSGKAKKHSANLQLAAIQLQTDGELFWKISNGNTGKGMPSFSKIRSPNAGKLYSIYDSLN